jgi:hypothetical protein
VRPSVRAAIAPLLAIAALGGPAPARAQTMADQEQRLIDIHALLLDLPPVQAPAALSRGEVGVSLEAVGIPPIDGTTGSRTQLTASDHTRLYPRPRVQLGLPSPEGARAFVGLSWIPPLTVRDVTTNALAAEAGFGAAPGALRFGARLHAVGAVARAPVTDPATRDELRAFLWGAELSAGWRFEGAGLALEPYAGAGVVSLHGTFRVESDGNVLDSAWTGAALHAGVRLLARARFEAVTEVDGYPGRLVHGSVRLGYLFGP